MLSMIVTLHPSSRRTRTVWLPVQRSFTFFKKRSPEDAKRTDSPSLTYEPDPAGDEYVQILHDATEYRDLA